MSTLSKIIANKLNPQVQSNPAEHFIVARPVMRASQMPHGVELIPHKIPGKRILVKGERLYQNTRGIIAHWPDMSLNEVSKLKLACVLEGYVDYQLGNYRVKCGPGNYIAIPPGIAHPDGDRSYLDAEKSAHCEVLFFLLHPDALECWISRLEKGKAKTRKGYLILNGHLTKLFQALMEELISGEDASFQTCGHLFTGFCSLLLREAVADRV